ncbi:conserved hypothetical protein [Pediculus humanus corporis]|uniref:Biogenesis of lysosome-related organelles complex 1 subunit 5 n=1 Tax=Pediculus humanus subsp. corporis TaxID=121224 RepID=E0W4A7_PEDHC|nr:uncharacterized protein Phum_PHUM617000 [Pediculus humanus corporis]EEB20463.1 conserved hypothetical protein [Pediculus humanus corporis]
MVRNVFKSCDKFPGEPSFVDKFVSIMANIFKDIGEIWTRLFDHRPFLNGEIRFILQEFEEKRGNKEVERLFAILQNITEIKYNQIDSIKLKADENLETLQNKIDDSLVVCNTILQEEEQYRTDTTILKNKERRKAEWDVFIKDISQKCVKIDEEFNVKEKDLRDYYADLDNITTIKDPTVYIKPGKILKSFLKENSLIIDGENNIPENIQKLLDSKNDFLNVESDMNWINQLVINMRNENENNLYSGKELNEKIEEMIKENYSNFDREEVKNEMGKNLPYLHELMKGSDVILPKNEVVERNPDLLKRIEKLKKEQEEREYKAMTQNVNLDKKHFPEDSVSYQMNMMNRHLIAVGQLLVSVGAGFAFGFLGVELIVGNLNFGIRLLLGIACALIIAVAEFYFLAKHLNEEDKKEKTTTRRERINEVPETKDKNNKLHKD